MKIYKKISALLLSLTLIGGTIVQPSTIVYATEGSGDLPTSAAVTEPTIELTSQGIPFSDVDPWDYTTITSGSTYSFFYPLTVQLPKGGRYHIIIDINPNKITDFPFYISSAPEPEPNPQSVDVKISGSKAIYTINTDEVDEFIMETKIGVSVKGDKGTTYKLSNGTAAGAIGDMLIKDPSAELGVNVYVSDKNSFEFSDETTDANVLEEYTISKSHDLDFSTQTATGKDILSNEIHHASGGKLPLASELEKFDFTNTISKDGGIDLYGLFLLPDGHVYFGKKLDEGYDMYIGEYTLSTKIENQKHYPMSDLKFNISLPDEFFQNTGRNSNPTSDNMFGGEYSFGYDMSANSSIASIIYDYNGTDREELFTTNFDKEATEFHYFQGSAMFNENAPTYIDYKLTGREYSSNSFNDYQKGTIQLKEGSIADYSEGQSFTAPGNSTITWNEYIPGAPGDAGRISSEDIDLGRVVINVPKYTMIDRLVSDVSESAVSEDQLANHTYNFTISNEHLADDLNDLKAIERYEGEVLTFTFPEGLDVNEFNLANFNANVLSFGSYWFDDNESEKIKLEANDSVTINEIPEGTTKLNIQISDEGLATEYDLYQKNDMSQISGSYTAAYTGSERQIKVLVDITDGDNVVIEENNIENRNIRLEMEGTDSGKIAGEPRPSIDLYWTVVGAADNLAIYIDNDFDAVSTMFNNNTSSKPYLLNNNGVDIEGLHIALDTVDYTTGENGIEDNEIDDSKVNSMIYKNAVINLDLKTDKHWEQVNQVELLPGTKTEGFTYSATEDPVTITYKLSGDEKEYKEFVNTNEGYTFKVPEGKYLSDLKITFPTLQAIPGGTQTTSSQDESIAILHYASDSSTPSGKFDTGSGKTDVFVDDISVTVTADNLVHEVDRKDDSVAYFAYKVKVSLTNASGNTDNKEPSNRSTFGFTDREVYFRFLREDTSNNVNPPFPDGVAVYYKMHDEFFRYVGNEEHIEQIKDKNGDTWLRVEVTESNKEPIETLIKRDYFYTVLGSNNFEPTYNAVDGRQYPLFLEAYADIGPILAMSPEESEGHDFIWGSTFAPKVVTDELELTQKTDIEHGVDTTSIIGGRRLIDFGFLTGGVNEDGEATGRLEVGEHLIPLITVNGAISAGIRMSPGIEGGLKLPIMEEAIATIEYQAKDYSALSLKAEVAKAASQDNYKIVVNIPTEGTIPLTLKSFITPPSDNWEIIYKNASGSSTAVLEEVVTIEVTNTSTVAEVATFEFPIVADSEELYVAPDNTISSVTATVTNNGTTIGTSTANYIFKWYEIGGTIFEDNNKNGIFDENEEAVTETPIFKDGTSALTDRAIVSYSAETGKYNIILPPKKTEPYSITYTPTDYAITDELPIDGDVRKNNNHPLGTGIQFNANDTTFSPVIDAVQNLTQAELDGKFADISIYSTQVWTVTFKESKDTTENIEQYTDVPDKTTVAETDLYTPPTGKEFLGWTTDENPTETSSRWDFNDDGNTTGDTEVTEHVILYPILKDIPVEKITVTFDTLDVDTLLATTTENIDFTITDANTTASKEIDKGGTIHTAPKSTDKANDNKVFEFWYIDVNKDGKYDEGDTKYSSTVIYNVNTTYIAKYKDTYTVTFEDLAGDTTTDVITDIETDIEGGSTIKETNVKVPDIVEGGRVEGWYTDKDFIETSKWDFDTNTVIKNETLYPKVEYPVIFKDPTDTNTELKNEWVENGGTVDNLTTEELTNKIPDGKEIIGWTTDDEPDENSELWDFGTGGDTVNKPVILYPILKDKEIVKHTVTFEDGNFNDNDIHDKETVLSGDTVDESSTVPNPPTEDAKFVGWYVDKELTIPFNFDDPITEDITLYPKYEDKELESIPNEETEDGNKPGVVPDTGDNGKFGLYLACSLLMLAIGFFAVLRKRRG